MTVAELVALLENYPEDSEVQIAHQPRYPLASTLSHVISEDEAEMTNDDSENGLPIVFLCEGTQIGYTSRNPWNGQ